METKNVILENKDFQLAGTLIEDKFGGLAGREPKLKAKDLIALCMDYCYFDDTNQEILENYDIKSNPSSFVRRAVRDGIISSNTFEVASQRRKKISDGKNDKGSKLQGEALRSFASDYIYSDLTSAELLKKHGIKHVSNSLKRAVREGFISESERKEASKRRKVSRSGENLKKSLTPENFERSRERAKNNIGEKNHFYGKRHTNKTKLRLSELRRELSKEEEIALAFEYIYFDDSFDELRKNYGVSDLGLHIRRVIEDGIISKEQYSEAESRKVSQRFNSDPRFIEIAMNNGLRLAKISRENKFELEGIKFDSKDEGAVYKLLEKYLKGYEPVEGKTFQVHSGNGAIFDFVLPNGQILEWHPINVRYDGRKCDRDTYKELSDKLGRDERREFRDWWKDELAVEYWIKRQEKADNSLDFAGREVLLVRNFDELYSNVLKKLNVNIPEYSQVKKEWKSIRKQVRKIGE
jgi:hypothetical protein